MSGISPSYRIGPADQPFLPSDLAADAATLNGQMNALDQLDNWPATTDDFFNSWNAFLQEWRGFYSSHFGGFWTDLATAANDSNRDQLVQFEVRFGNFASQYQAQTSQQLPGGVVQPSQGASDTLGAAIRNQLQPILPSIDWRWVALGIAAAVVAIAWTVRR